MRNFLVIMILGHISHNNEKLCLTEKLSHNNKTLSLTYLLLRKCNVIILNGIFLLNVGYFFFYIMNVVRTFNFELQTELLCNRL